MKQNLLQLTQTILSDMSSDEVNSISDTAESLQVANHIRETYFNMLSRYNLPEHDQLFQLDSSQNDDQPVLMFVPEGINRIEWIQYFDTNPEDGAAVQTDQFGAFSHDLNTDLQNNAGGWVTTSTTSNTIGLGSFTFTVGVNLNISVNDTAFISSAASPQNKMSGNVISYSGSTLVVNVTSMAGSGTFTNWNITQSNTITVGPGYRYVKVLPLAKFLHYQNQLQPTNQTNVETFQFTMNNVATGNNSTYTINFKNDQQPQSCCVISNRFVIFDSYDATQDSTLQSAKTMCYGWILPVFKMEDSFVPMLDDKQFPLLLNESKSLSFFELKQQPHQKAEKEIGRQISALQKYKSESSKPSDFDMLPNYGRRGWM